MKVTFLFRQNRNGFPELLSSKAISACLIFITLLLSIVFSKSSSAIEVVYPNRDGIGTSALGYSVLKLALEKSGEDYQLILDDKVVNSQRLIRMATTNQIDVIDGGYLPAFLEELDIIYKPIDMGVSGWRLFITRKENVSKLNKVNDLQDLVAFTVGQGTGWHDNVILENAGFKVITAPTIQNLFLRVNAERFHLLPLGAHEAYGLLEKFGPKDHSLVVDENITLFYPFGRFFYLHPSNKKLKAIIEKGLEKALEDGSLFHLLRNHKYSKDAFERANMDKRTVIRVDTPGLTREFENIDPKWWVTP
ncbi:hypothetical protein [Glaciecola sp. 1036]|uniref:hypothetical protein n=1 Tax=Alteromonadaceae TaxID=72275 RepID=UPI003D07217B